MSERTFLAVYFERYRARYIIKIKAGILEHIHKIVRLFVFLFGKRQRHVVDCERYISGKLCGNACFLTIRNFFRFICFIGCILCICFPFVPNFLRKTVFLRRFFFEVFLLLKAFSVFFFLPESLYHIRIFPA